MKVNGAFKTIWTEQVLHPANLSPVRHHTPFCLKSQHLVR
jgi:hypothetical protein